MCRWGVCVLVVAGLLNGACERREPDLGQALRTRGAVVGSSADTGDLPGPTLAGEADPANSSPRASRHSAAFGGPGWSLRPRNVDRRDSLRTLVGVRWARNAGFDRWVFEFADAVPGYAIAWVPSPGTACGSGEPIVAPGAAWLRVRLFPAQAHTSEGQSTVAQRWFDARLPAVVAAVLACDFEADVTWILAARRPTPFRVLALGNPPRLVVDVAHPRD